MEPAQYLPRLMAKRSVLFGRIAVDMEVIVAEQETHISTDDARSGSTPHIVRYILGISLALVIVAMIVILGIGTK
jgi:hypothetical protein